MLRWRPVASFAALLALALLSAPRAFADGTIYGCANSRTHNARRIMTSPADVSRDGDARGT